MRKVLRQLPPSPERTVARIMEALREERGIRLTRDEVQTLFLIRDLEEISKDLKILEDEGFV